MIGPRQVGKTTLALKLSDEVASLYLDLEASQDRRKLSDAALFLRQYEDRLVILDEIHRVPELFSTLRGLIDQGRRRGHRTGRFLLLGSASMDLLRQSGESLAGRIAHVDLGPFDVLELESSTVSDLTPLWVRGGFPDSYLAESDRHSFAWRKDFVRTYLERDIPLLGPRIPAETLENLWTMLAHNQGGLLNASRLAAALMASAQTVTRYVDLLVDLLLVRRLRPFHHNAGKRIVKSPKVYLRDSGIVHALLGIVDYNALAGHPVVGSSWEGFVIENLLAAAPDLTIASFYRTSAGAEVDLVLEIPGQGLWAIDIKRGLAARPEKGFYSACEDLKPIRSFAVNSGDDHYRISGELEAIGLKQLAAELAAL
ncbi:MAG TPA: ATP-binding protein [Bryobacteraceae bacterium]|nr:ATP-binding protein [Bryobacteraceae bacterium]